MFAKSGTCLAAILLAFATAGVAQSQPVEQIQSLARTERPALLDTLKSLVSIESGSRDLEGLAKIGGVIAERLRALGGAVEMVDPAEVYRMDDTPQQVGQRKLRVAPTTRVGQMLLDQCAHPQTLLQLPHENQAAVRGDPRSLKIDPQGAVEGQLKRLVVLLTHEG